MSHLTATMDDYLEKLATLQKTAGSRPVFVVWTGTAPSCHNHDATEYPHEYRKLMSLEESCFACELCSQEPLLKGVLTFSADSMCQLNPKHSSYCAAEPKDDRKPRTTWCPDCNRCVPAVIDVTQKRNAYLLEVSVGPKEVYKAPEFYLRSSPEYRDTFAGIPTLAVYKNDTLIATTTNELCDAQSHDAAVAVCELFLDKYNTPSVSTTAVMLGLTLAAVGVAAAVVLIRRSRST